MRNSLGSVLRRLVPPRTSVCVLSLCAVTAAGGIAAAPHVHGAPPSDHGAGVETPALPASVPTALPASPTRSEHAEEAEEVPFTQRFHAVQHGGIVRAANVSITCRGAESTSTPTDGGEAVSCADARAGKAAATNDEFDMFYTDVDSDANTYNSSRAELRVPSGSKVSYARLYWGGNLRAGEQKPAVDNDRVLVAEPEGQYKEVLADSVVGHRTAGGADAFQASADVTAQVRAGGSGQWTVGQLNVAMGTSGAGAWGGWTLVVAYEKQSEPLRQLALWDGFAYLGEGHHEAAVRLDGVTVPAGGGGTAGFVAYNGDAGTTGDALTVSVGRREGSTLKDARNPAGDLLNSTVNEPGTQGSRNPSYIGTLGYDSDVFDLGDAVAAGGGRLDVRLTSEKDVAWAGVLFAAVDTDADAR
ncbi:DUF3344 domain-containing protein [Streptomyces sp. NPDC059578]|uniref:DUF3344 domain-containing protein n=1 Tax=Streptomyces sp. NPDC059578 TaxID=3346874 RepID=UPI0036B979DA